MKKRAVAVLISGSGSNLQALVDGAAAPDYPARIALVLSNKPDAYGLTRAQAAGISTSVIRHTDYQSRVAFDTALHEALLAAEIEFVCLAGFMRVLTAEFVSKWQGRIINIHPSLLPLFKGMHTHAQALEAGVRIHGCSVHYVVPEMDSGPLIGQAAVPVLAGDTAETLGARVLDAEHILYPLALARVLGEKGEIATDNKIISVFMA